VSPPAQVRSDPPKERASENKGDEEMNEVASRRREAVYCSLPKDLEQLPSQLPVSRQDRLTEATAEV
jgi:hypothetical protein